MPDKEAQAIAMLEKLCSAVEEYGGRSKVGPEKMLEAVLAARKFLNELKPVQSEE